MSGIIVFFYLQRIVKNDIAFNLPNKKQLLSTYVERSAHFMIFSKYFRRSVQITVPYLQITTRNPHLMVFNLL